MSSPCKTEDGADGEGRAMEMGSKTRRSNEDAAVPHPFSNSTSSILAKYIKSPNASSSNPSGRKENESSEKRDGDSGRAKLNSGLTEPWCLSFSLLDCSFYVMKPCT